MPRCSKELTDKNNRSNGCFYLALPPVPLLAKRGKYVAFWVFAPKPKPFAKGTPIVLNGRNVLQFYLFAPKIKKLFVKGKST